MNEEELKRMKTFNHDFVKDLENMDKASPRGASPEPVDIYQRNQDRLYEVSKKSFPKGSSAIVNTATLLVIDGEGGEGLAHAHKRAKEDIETLKSRGEKGRVELRRRQYMDEYFLPALEIVINSASPDELLANESALKELDKYVLLEGSGKGYTASYIRQAYGNLLGQVQGRSDDSVRSGVRDINILLDEGQNRTAFGLAVKLKEQIDKGKHQASDEDYEMIEKIVTYYK